MARRLTPTIEKTCEFCGRPFLAKMKRARYCDNVGCASARETEYKRLSKARKAST